MTHIDSVDQKELIKYYEKAKVFVLPSREEGLAMVQMQALVCGLPIVCSKDTGGRDLKKFLSDEKWVIEMESFDLEALHNSIEKGLEISAQQKGIRDQSKEIAQKLDWKSYGNRYQENIKTAIFK
jgi:glycosyltransferase involved in cell wall biosynthesis